MRVKGRWGKRGQKADISRRVDAGAARSSNNLSELTPCLEFALLASKGKQEKRALGIIEFILSGPGNEMKAV